MVDFRLLRDLLSISEQKKIRHFVPEVWNCRTANVNRGLSRHDGHGNERTSVFLGMGIFKCRSISRTVVDIYRQETDDVIRDGLGCYSRIGT
jgi:hypothetical protein